MTIAKNTGFDMGYAKTAERKREWENLKPEIYRAMRQGLNVQEFWDLKGWNGREPWYAVKPVGFHWSRVQKELLATGKPPEETPEPEPKKETIKTVPKENDTSETDNEGLRRGQWFNLGELQNKLYQDLNEEELKVYKKVYNEQRRKILQKYRCKTLIELRNTYNVKSIDELLEKKIMPLHVVYQKEREANQNLKKKPEEPKPEENNELVLQKQEVKQEQPTLINDNHAEIVHSNVKISFEGEPSAIRSMLKELLRG